jgi:hypothetical protein
MRRFEPGISQIAALYWDSIAAGVSQDRELVFNRDLFDASYLGFANVPSLDATAPISTTGYFDERRLELTVAIKYDDYTNPRGPEATRRNIPTLEMLGYCGDLSGASWIGVDSRDWSFITNVYNVQEALDYIDFTFGMGFFDGWRIRDKAYDDYEAYVRVSENGIPPDASVRNNEQGKIRGWSYNDILFQANMIAKPGVYSYILQHNSETYGGGYIQMHINQGNLYLSDFSMGDRGFSLTHEMPSNEIFRAGLFALNKSYWYLGGAGGSMNANDLPSIYAGNAQDQQGLYISLPTAINVNTMLGVKEIVSSRFGGLGERNMARVEFMSAEDLGLTSWKITDSGGSVGGVNYESYLAIGDASQVHPDSDDDYSGYPIGWLNGYSALGVNIQTYFPGSEITSKSDREHLVNLYLHPMRLSTGVTDISSMYLHNNDRVTEGYNDWCDFIYKSTPITGGTPFTPSSIYDFRGYFRIAAGEGATNTLPNGNDSGSWIDEIYGTSRSLKLMHARPCYLLKDTSASISGWDMGMSQIELYPGSISFYGAEQLGEDYQTSGLNGFNASISTSLQYYSGADLYFNLSDSEFQVSNTGSNVVYETTDEATGAKSKVTVSNGGGFLLEANNDTSTGDRMMTHFIMGGNAMATCVDPESEDLGRQHSLGGTWITMSNHTYEALSYEDTTQSDMSTSIAIMAMSCIDDSSSSSLGLFLNSSKDRDQIMGETKYLTATGSISDGTGFQFASDYWKIWGGATGTDVGVYRAPSLKGFNQNPRYGELWINLPDSPFDTRGEKENMVLCINEWSYLERGSTTQQSWGHIGYRTIKDLGTGLLHGRYTGKSETYEDDNKVWKLAHIHVLTEDKPDSGLSMPWGVQWSVSGCNQGSTSGSNIDSGTLVTARTLGGGSAYMTVTYGTIFNDGGGFFDGNISTRFMVAGTDIDGTDFDVLFNCCHDSQIDIVPLACNNCEVTVFTDENIPDISIYDYQKTGAVI